MERVRIAKTRDGRFVPDTHPDAAVLVYVGDSDKAPDDMVAKMKRGPAQDKQRKRRPRNKAKVEPEAVAPTEPADESATG